MQGGGDRFVQVRPEARVFFEGEHAEQEGVPGEVEEPGGIPGPSVLLPEVRQIFPSEIFACLYNV